MLKTLKQKIKHFVNEILKIRREDELKQTARHVSRQEITRNLCNMGIKQGDILFIHSSLKSLGFVPGGPKEVIAGLLDAVGSEGTLLLPTYYMPGGTILGTCKLEDYVFDPRHQGSNMGAMPAAFLEFPSVHRSIHPTHSVSAIGKHAQYLTEAHHQSPSVFGTGSPWQRFHELNGKVLGIGISLGPVTFYHLLEDTLGVDFPINVWEDETYRIPCKGWAGEDYLVPVRPYRAEITPDRIDQKPREDLRQFFWDDFSAAGILHTGKIGDAPSWFINADDFFERLKTLSTQKITIYSKATEIILRKHT
jgi:aminoglycoside 3-N-acetyltransferase